MIQDGRLGEIARVDLLSLQSLNAFPRELPKLGLVDLRAVLISVK